MSSNKPSLNFSFSKRIAGDNFVSLGTMIKMVEIAGVTVDDKLFGKKMMIRIEKYARTNPS